MRKIFWLFVIVLFSASIFLFFSKDQKITLPEIISPTPTPLPVKLVTHYYVPVVELSSEIENLDSASISQYSIVTINENVDIFPDGFQADVVGIEALDGEIKAGKIAILTIDQLQPGWKVVKYENQSILEDFNADTYPLKYIEKRPGEEGTAENIDENEMLKLFVGGEIIPARAVDRLALNVNNNYTYLFDDLKQEIEWADLAIAQLENPVLGDPKPCTGCTVFSSDDRVVQGLKKVGFDMIAASGNHMGDAGQQGYSNTQKIFEEVGLPYTGMGKGDAELMRPVVSEVNGRRVGMLSADDVAYFYWSGDDTKYSTNRFSKLIGSSVVPDLDRIAKIQKVKEDNQIDFLIIYESWGVEYKNKANAHQTTLAKAFIDNGADLVVASHPHWVQNFEFYKGKPIFYSLGNLIFDQTHTLETRQSIALNLVFYKNELKSINMIPLQTCGYHQTKNNLTDKYLNGEISLADIKLEDEKNACVYWMPRKVTKDLPQYNQILDRVYEFSPI